MVESPRWLLRNNRVEEAHSVLKYMAKLNGSEEVSLEALQAISEQEQKERANSSGKRSNAYIISQSIFIPIF